MNFSTIAAISTPPGKGGVALIRISGPEAFFVAEKVFSPIKGEKVTDFSPRVQIYGDIVSGDEIIDDGLLTFFPAPHSFTGENVVEIACHGGEIITSMVLRAVLCAGAVMAKPGEFSRRAFVNGKMSLTSAEGIADLLDAKTEEAAKLSSKTSRGKLSKVIEEVSEKILSVSSSLWAYLDYPEDELGIMSDEEMISRLSDISFSCRKLLDTFRTGRAVNSGIPCAIVGKPNVGKSTFFNLLLGEEKAIVTDIPGTTRDVIEYPVKAGKVLLNLSDTAGLRENTDDKVELFGMEKALQTLNDAELVFALFDLSRPLEEDDKRVLKKLSERGEEMKIIPVFTKADKERKLDRSVFSDLGEGFEFSFVEESDINPLIEKIEDLFISDRAALREGQILTNVRQKVQLEKCADLINTAKEQIETGLKDLASLTMEEALSALLEVDGKSAGDMILDQVFSRFCVGK